MSWVYPVVAAPVSLPHSCHVDVEVGGYTIPKDAVVYAVLGSAHEDQTEWEDPSEFRPERWIHDGKVEPKHNAFMPFSLGMVSWNSSSKCCNGNLITNLWYPAMC